MIMDSELFRVDLSRVYMTLNVAFVLGFIISSPLQGVLLLLVNMINNMDAQATLRRIHGDKTLSDNLIKNYI